MDVKGSQEVIEVEVSSTVTYNQHLIQTNDHINRPDYAEFRN